MSETLARALMILARRCLGTRRDEWARAMQIEFEAAVPEGRRLVFAIGCLIAACREMPRHDEGQLSLARHALALAGLLPMAAMLFTQAGRLGRSAYVYGVVDSVGSQNPFMAGGQLAAAPSLLFLWLMLGAAHLCLAWVLLEKDWSRVFNIGAMIVAGTTTLAIYSGVLFVHDGRLALDAIATTIELTAIFAAARWHGRATPFRRPRDLS